MTFSQKEVKSLVKSSMPWFERNAARCCRSGWRHQRSNCCCCSILCNKVDPRWTSCLVVDLAVTNQASVHKKAAAVADLILHRSARSTQTAPIAGRLQHRFERVLVCGPLPRAPSVVEENICVQESCRIKHPHTQTHTRMRRTTAFTRSGTLGAGTCCLLEALL